MKLKQLGRRTAVEDPFSFSFSTLFDHFVLAADLSEGVDASLKIGFGMCGRNLNADSGAIFRNDGKTETDDVNSSFEHFVGELTGQTRIAQHHRTDRMLITENLNESREEKKDLLINIDTCRVVP